MAHAQPAPVSPVVKVTILADNRVKPETAEAQVGDIIQFHNEDHTPKMIRFAINDDATEFYPLGLLIQAHSYASILAVDPETGNPTESASYRISTVGSGSHPGDGPDDDPYVIVVGSNDLKNSTK
jgi:hypothetical protein